MDNVESVSRDLLHHKFKLLDFGVGLDFEIKLNNPITSTKKYGKDQLAS